MGISRELLDFYLPIFRQLLASGVALLLPLALEIVRSLADTKQTGAKKREAAVSQLKEAAVEVGIAASEHLIRLTVETAVARLKTEQAG